MSPRRTGSRALVLLWAALQLALPGVAAFAEGFASRTSVHATAHVESSTERDCIRVHETDCVFCQFLSASATPAHGVAPAVEPRALEHAVARGADRLVVRVLAASASPRAPPTV